MANIEAKTLGMGSLAGLVTAAVLVGTVANMFFPSKEQFSELRFQVQLNQMRLDSAFGPLKFPTGLNPPSTSSLPDPNVVHAADKEPQSAQEKLEAYRKALNQGIVVLPESFIQKCAELGFWKGDSPVVYDLKGADGRDYSLDQTIACIIRLVEYK